MEDVWYNDYHLNEFSISESIESCGILLVSMAALFSDPTLLMPNWASGTIILKVVHSFSPRPAYRYFNPSSMDSSLVVYLTIEHAFQLWASFWSSCGASRAKEGQSTKHVICWETEKRTYQREYFNFCQAYWHIIRHGQRLNWKLITLHQ